MAKFDVCSECLHEKSTYVDFLPGDHIHVTEAEQCEVTDAPRHETDDNDDED